MSVCAPPGRFEPSVWQALSESYSCGALQNVSLYFAKKLCMSLRNATGDHVGLDYIDYFKTIKKARRQLHCTKRGCVQDHEMKQGMRETKEERQRTHNVLFKNRVKTVSLL